MGKRSATAAFTVIDVLVITLLCLFLMMVLPPVLRGPWSSVAYTNTCGTNLSGMGKAMLIYANDYDSEFPRAGDRNATWGTSVWNAQDRFTAYRIGPGTSMASVSSALYLLVKYTEMRPKSFVCKSDAGVTEWKIGHEAGAPRGMELIDAWDFGSRPREHVSYAYHYPFRMYALTTSRDPRLAVAADRNPWIDSPFVKARDFSKFKPGATPSAGAADQFRSGNSLAHKEDGQNVLFLDTHVDFAKWPNCGVDQDNVYTSWDGGDKLRGQPPVLGSLPADPKDSLLVNDPAVTPSRVAVPGRP